MIKEVICRLKLQLSLSLHKLSITVQHFLYNTHTVDKTQYRHGSVMADTQNSKLFFFFFKSNRIKFHRKPQTWKSFQRHFKRFLLDYVSHLQLHIYALLVFTFDILMLRGFLCQFGRLFIANYTAWTYRGEENGWGYLTTLCISSSWLCGAAQSPSSQHQRRIDR